ncbi:hypothetical protein tb265_15660 [Gemmatimonadetes bacterium T265]|nr:hypothetical protein tb265_15660 [Gemmatimonadetes bacterium T265]
MTGFILCVSTFVIAVIAGRRSLVGGLGATMAVGYWYGYLRAVVPSSASHFVFDSAVIGLYVVQLFRMPAEGEPRESKGTRLWTIALAAWPVLLMAVPTQEPLVQLVGLRAAVLVLPFMLLGGRLTSRDVYRLALWCAALNVVAFAFGAAEFTFGLEKFLPHNAVTELNFLQDDAGGFGAGVARSYRIPSTFPTSHAYGGTMVVTLPLLIGAWARRGSALWQRLLLMSALVASGLGVFLAASRYHALVMFVVLLVATFSGRVRVIYRVGAVVAILAVGVLVAKDSRLQRFKTLQDTEYVSTRVGYSANRDVFTILAEHPLGNGLGGGGTNMPYFLRNRVHDLVAIENEYAKIALEQGFPGLTLWVVFLGWAFMRRPSAAGDPWFLGRRLAWTVGATYFSTAWIGLGMLTAIPQSALLLLCTGWMLTGRDGARRGVVAGARPWSASPRVDAVPQFAGPQHAVPYLGDQRARA